MEYPCSVCALECLQDTIQCSNCKNWIHSKCINLNDKELRAWSAAHLNFLCPNCVFSESSYDASAALARLQLALSSNRRNILSNQAKSESKLLETYKVELPALVSDIETSQVDDEAVKILNMFQPVMNSVYIPLRTVGDGNCLYRAVSRVLTGNEKSHLLLRLLTSLELIHNRSSYDTNKKYNDFINDVRIVTSAYNKLLNDALVENSFSEMAHLYALSAALDEPIQSYYPPQIKTDLSSAFTRIVKGDSTSNDKSPRIMLMWTSMIAPMSLSMFQQRTNLFKRFRQFVVKDDKIVISTDGRSAVIAPRTEGKKPGQRKRKVNVRTLTINTKKTKQ